MNNKHALIILTCLTLLSMTLSSGSVVAQGQQLPMYAKDETVLLPEESPVSVRGHTTIMSEGFEGAFPNGLWSVYDGDGAANGEYLWDDDDYYPHIDDWSAWVAGAGANGLDPAYDNYANNMQSWMVYGPFDLSEATAASVSFCYWNQSELNYDYFTFTIILIPDS